MYHSYVVPSNQLLVFREVNRFQISNLLFDKTSVFLSGMLSVVHMPVAYCYALAMDEERNNVSTKTTPTISTT